jgi:multiple sugar transport system ATP-binding protein
VERNLSFGLRVRGLPRAEIGDRVRRAAELLHLDGLLGRKPAELSGGQRQRVAIGRALVREARTYLLDEPLSNLDASLRGTLRRELKLLHQRLGATMIYVTHDQVEAMTLATRIAVMCDGRVQQVGAPGEVYAEPANRFVAGFLGAPPMNFVGGTCRTTGAGLGFSSPGLALDLADYEIRGALPIDGEPVVLGVRPEHVRIGQAGASAGRIALVEPMGNHQVVWLEFGGTTLAVMCHESENFNVGEAVRFSIDADKVSLFDPTGGQRR